MPIEPTKVTLDERSLTPHGDVAERAIAEMRAKLADRLAAPGDRGRRARVALALNETYARLWAAELDAGAGAGRLAVDIANAIGGVTAAMAIQATHRQPLAERVQFAMMISSLVGKTCVEIVAGSDNLKPHEFTGVSAEQMRKPGHA
jgi:hypothetical protein